MYTRRQWLAAMVKAAVSVACIAAVPRKAEAYLLGRWRVRCPNGHVDIVTGGTKQHVCETCGQQAFSGNTVTVMCPNGHANRVDTGTDGVTSVLCSNCKADCRIPEPRPATPPSDKGKR